MLITIYLYTFLEANEKLSFSFLFLFLSTELSVERVLIEVMAGEDTGSEFDSIFEGVEIGLTSIEEALVLSSSWVIFSLGSLDLITIFIVGVVCLI